MYLKRLEITGFKSFAGNSKLEFGPGITGIVGPNGSGKSNIADAVRWVLGEQSPKTLRLKKSEELVFAGTAKRPRASLAEATILLDNTDQAAPIEFSEIALSRILYRSGDSEYRLNGRKVKLTEIQHLLASAGFGTNSYAVIGQGMIDTFILVSPAERKLLFDEASGIRQYDLKREQAISKLEATEANLVRLRDIVTELKPRQAVLGRSVEAAKERQVIQTELDRARQVYLVTAKQHSLDQSKRGQSALTKTKADIQGLTATIKELEAQVEAATSAQVKTKHQRDARLKRLYNLEVRRDKLSNSLSVKRAELQMLMERVDDQSTAQLKQVKAELGHCQLARSQVKSRLSAAKRDEIAATDAMDQIARQVTGMQRKLTKLRVESTGNDQYEYVVHALGLLKHLAHSLAEGDMAADELKLVIYKAGRLLSNATKQDQSEALEEIKDLQAELTDLMKKREQSHEEYTNVVIKLRSLELDAAHLDDTAEQLNTHILQIEERLKTQPPATAKLIADRQKSLTILETELSQVSSQVVEERSALSTDASDAGATAMFSLASKLESSKHELGAKLGQVKQLEADLAGAATDLDRYQEMAKNWPKLNQHLKPSSEPIDVLERTVLVLESKLAGSGEADQDMVEEYDQVSQRLTYLTSQVDDLEQAKMDLTKVISQLETMIKSRFETAFRAIADHFQTYFAKLFGGGRADLTLSQEAGIYGIDIKALPPGKRVQSLPMLSGGERSLTGIALLAAILAVNPSPFVVLDEVDASLDEANSARFADILREIAKVSQLIVITHNRQTMQAAQSLYGVTMDEQQVSNLLSLKLEQAKTLAGT